MATISMAICELDASSVTPLLTSFVDAAGASVRLIVGQQYSVQNSGPFRIFIAERLSSEPVPELGDSVVLTISTGGNFVWKPEANRAYFGWSASGTSRSGPRGGGLVFSMRVTGLRSGMARSHAFEQHFKVVVAKALTAMKHNGRMMMRIQIRPWRHGQGRQSCNKLATVEPPVICGVD